MAAVLPCLPPLAYSVEAQTGSVELNVLPMPVPGGGVLFSGGSRALFRAGHGIQGIQARQQLSGSSGEQKFSFLTRWDLEVRQLTQLEDNWDGEGAPKPNPSTIGDAAKIIEAASLDGFEPTSVDPDVLGGVGIYFDSSSGEHAWVSVMNDGLRAVLFAYKGRRIKTVALTPEESWPHIRKFLTGDHSVEGL